MYVKCVCMYVCIYVMHLGAYVVDAVYVCEVRMYVLLCCGCVYAVICMRVFV